jgi:hypothetical protein
MSRLSAATESFDLGQATLNAVDDPTGGADDSVARERKKEKVPPHARIWGFVRNLAVGESLNATAAKNAVPQEHDATLWWDADQHRFLVVSENWVIDDLSPLQFVQFVRQLRDVTSRILFKFERREDGSTGRAYRIWS